MDFHTIYIRTSPTMVCQVQGYKPQVSLTSTFHHQQQHHHHHHHRRTLHLPSFVKLDFLRLRYPTVIDFAPRHNKAAERGRHGRATGSVMPRSSRVFKRDNPIDGGRWRGRKDGRQQPDSSHWPEHARCAGSRCYWCQHSNTKTRKLCERKSV